MIKSNLLKRLEQTLSRELSIIVASANNEYLKGITITGCNLANNKAYCRVYIMIDEKYNEKKVLEELDKAESYISKEISKKIQFRKTPTIKFLIDNSYEYGKKIDEQLEKIKERQD